METNDIQVIVRLIKKLADDPLSSVFVCEIKTAHYMIRFNSGYVQIRRKTDKVFGFGLPANEWLAKYGYVAA